MKKLLLSKGKYALVDDADFEMLNKHKWFYGGPHYAMKNSTNEITKKRESVYMHRFILGAKKGIVVDHINHDTLDNRRENIRICTTSENFANRLKKKGCTSKYKGVWQYFSKSIIKWQAYIKKDKVRHHLGNFNTEKEAALAYNTAAQKIFGEFALLNKI